MEFSLPIITTVHEGNKGWINKYPVTKFEIDNTDNLKQKIELFYKIKPKKKNIILIGLIMIIYAKIYLIFITKFKFIYVYFLQVR